LTVVTNQAKTPQTADALSSIDYDENLVIIADWGLTPTTGWAVSEEHSLDEERYITLGLSSQGRLLMLAHTEREGRIRIISARVATKKEQNFYAEAN